MPTPSTTLTRSLAANQPDGEDKHDLDAAPRKRQSMGGLAPIGTTRDDQQRADFHSITFHLTRAHPFYLLKGSVPPHK